MKSYTKIVVTEEGGSSFEDAEIELSEVGVGEGLAPMLVGMLGPVGGAAYCRFGSFGSDPHRASEPQWVIPLSGRFEVEVSDGTTRQFGPGDLVLATDTTGRGHITRVLSDEPVEALGISPGRD